MRNDTLYFSSFPERCRPLAASLGQLRHENMFLGDQAQRTSQVSHRVDD